MTNLGEKASQLNYNVVQRGPRGEELIQKVTNKQTTPEGEISGTVPELVDPTVPSENRERKNAPVRVPKVYIKWEEQQIGEDTYAKGRSPGYFAPPRALPKPRPPVTAPVTPVVTPKPPVPPKPPVRTPERPPVTIPKPPVKIPPKEVTLKSAGKIARPLKRELSARVEELMKKRGFPKAVREAIEKGIERKDAPRNIERIIEKVAKTNEPDYILRRTIAKRIGTRGTVQYKVETDKGEIIYENADEKTVNAILGMPGPRGEIIPLQIKVIR
jgi:predicted DNA-binding protein